jgi:hypothetical protein
LRFTSLRLPHVLVILLATLSSLVLPPLLHAQLSPAVISVGSTDAVVALPDWHLTHADSVQVQDCDGNTIITAPSRTTPARVRVPASMVRRPCVLQVGLAGAMQGLPLAIADPALLALPPVHPPDPNDSRAWSGSFDMLCDQDTTATPPHQSLVAVRSDSTIRAPFVLGKNERVLMRLATAEPLLRPDTSTEGCRYVLLPGVRSEDVRWGPDDIEGFWIGNLAEDGRSIGERQFLSDMVTEPSGPLDAK